VNMRGSATEMVAIEFNRIFRLWTIKEDSGGPVPGSPLESGFMLDVNVYAQDYTRELGLRFKKANVPDQDFWPAQGTQQYEEAEGWQDVYSLMKIRRYMSDAEWKRFRQSIRRQLEGSQMQSVTAQRFADVDELWKSPVALQGNDKTQAENALYEAQLREVYLKRGFGQQLSDDEKVVLARELGKASFLAQEAYHSAGAVRDVVCNLQMGQGLALSLREQLHSFNEQMGDLFKEAGHMNVPALPNPDPLSIDFAVTASKYMVRLGSAALRANYNVFIRLLNTLRVNVSSPSNEPDEAKLSEALSKVKVLAEASAFNRATSNRLAVFWDLQEEFNSWCKTALDFMKVKDNPEQWQTVSADGKSRTWNKALTTMLASAPWQSDLAPDGMNFRTKLLTIAAVTNVLIRDLPENPTRAQMLNAATERRRQSIAQ